MGRKILGKPNIGSQKNVHLVSCTGKVPWFYANKGRHVGLTFLSYGSRQGPLR